MSSSRSLTARSLTIIAPQIAPSLTQAMAQRSGRWPALARFAGRGSIRELPLADVGNGLQRWQLALLDALHLDDPNEYPSAAVTRSGDAAVRASGFWMHALPMHFVAGLDRLTAVMLRGDTRVTHAERAELEPTIAAHMRSAGFELLRTEADEWLVHSNVPMDVLMAPPEEAAAAPLAEMMPRGRDAGVVRRLMTELQMLLHEHPVSVRRVQRGVPEINAIWFHGAGALGDAQRHSLPQGFGSDAYLRGLYRLNDLDVAGAPADAKALLGRLRSRAVAVVDAYDLDMLEVLWLAPLTGPLVAGIITRLEVVLDRWQIAVPRGALLKFWRAQRNPGEWLAC
jgi:hypothetical protein